MTTYDGGKHMSDIFHPLNLCALSYQALETIKSLLNEKIERRSVV